MENIEVVELLIVFKNIVTVITVYLSFYSTIVHFKTNTKYYISILILTANETKQTSVSRNLIIAICNMYLIALM